MISQEFDRQIQDLRDRNFVQAAVDLTHSKELWLRDEVARETALGQALNAQKLLYTDGNSAVARWQKQIADTQQKNDRIGGSKKVSAAYKALSAAQKAAIDQLLAQVEPAVRRAQDQIDQSLEERYRHATTDAINEAFGRMGFTSFDERPLLEKLYRSWESTIAQMVKEHIVIAHTQTDILTVANRPVVTAQKVCDRFNSVIVIVDLEPVGHAVELSQAKKADNHQGEQEQVAYLCGFAKGEEQPRTQSGESAN